MVHFVIIDLIVTSYLFLFLIICIDFYAYFGISILDHKIFSLSHWFDLIWVNN